jgi:hypothetical protein
MSRLAFWLINLFVLAISFFVALDLLEYFEGRSSAPCAHASCCPKGQEFVLAPPFSVKLGDYGYKVSIPQLMQPGDTEANMQRSRTVMCEGDLRIGPGHTPYTEIGTKGFGRFIHYQNEIAFSSSDNTDPNSNGRQYKIVIPLSFCRGVAFLLALCDP